MPEFDIDQWLAENGYTDTDGDGIPDGGGDISTQGSDYWSGGYEGISGMFTVQDLITGSGADPVVESMYEWAQANQGYSDEEFAQELFIQMYNASSEEAQQEFVNTWNNNYADEWVDTGQAGYEITDNASLLAAAGIWADNYGSALAGQGFFPPDAMDFDFGSATGLIAGEGGLLDQYNAQWGADAWNNMYQQAALLDEDYALEAQQIENDLLHQLQGLEIAAGGAKKQYSLLQADVLSGEQARGLTRTRRGLEGNNVDLGVLSAQLQGMHNQAEGAVVTTDMNLDILNTEWDNYLSNLFQEFEVNADTEFAQLITDIDDIIDAYNEAVIDETDFQESDIWNSIAGILNAGGMIPPTEGGGWENSGQGWMCITDSGNFGVLCGSDTENEGSCVSHTDECGSTLEGEGDDDDDVYQSCEEQGLITCGGGQLAGQCVQDAADCDVPGGTGPDCSDPSNQGEPECMGDTGEGDDGSGWGIGETDENDEALDPDFDPDYDEDWEYDEPDNPAEEFFS